MTEHPPPGIDPAITSYYDNAPEETRLEVGSSRLEAERTRELILRHLPKPPAVMLDVGGAAGAYAFWLADRGFDVHLLDATPRLVEVARQRNESAARKLASCHVADARSLPNDDESADVVLMLGPLYHLQERKDRVRAISEAGRVLRPGGVLIAAAISRLASTLDGLARELLRDPDFVGIVERDLREGRHRNPTMRLDYFTTAYFHRPEELKSEVVDAGLEAAALYGIEGPAWMLPDLGERWEDSDRREIVLRVARALEAEPSAIGCSAHLLIVGRKPY
jgi:SAM-dependent methyltransferase